MSKNSPVVLLLFFLVAGLMLVTPTSSALPTPPAAQQGQSAVGGGGQMGMMTPENRLKWMTEKLNLTDDQQTKIKPILEDETNQMKSLHTDTSMAPQDRRAKMKSIHEDTVNKINAILTPEQQTKWKEARQEMMEKHREMKGGMAPQ